MNLSMIIKAVNGIQGGMDIKDITAACLDGVKDSAVDVNAFLESAN